MSDFDIELQAAQEEAARSRRMAKWTMLGLALLSLILIGAVAVAAWLANDNGRLAAQARGYGVEQQQEKQNLAQEFDDACKSADFQSSAAGSNICRKAEQVAAEPSSPMAGPQGVQGLQGIPGKDGAPGKDSTVPGPMGPVGPAGVNGLDSTIAGPQGLTGAPGADSTVPGPAGPKGDPGPAGADGAPVAAASSFTFKDAAGTTYTCTPNPPGSSTYTCTSDGVPGK